MLQLIILFAVALALAGCQTRYTEMGYRGGVSAEQLGDHQFRITARGNGFTKVETVNNYLLLKAAEVTIQNGGRYFTGTDLEDLTEVNVVHYRATRTYYGGGVYSYEPAYNEHIIKPGKDMVITVIPGYHAKMPKHGIDAVVILENISPLVKRPEGEADTSAALIDMASQPDPVPDPSPAKPARAARSAKAPAPKELETSARLAPYLAPKQ